MYISQCASQLGNPELHRLFGKSLSRDMKSKIAAGHQVHHNIPRQLLAYGAHRGNIIAHMYSMSWKLYRKLQMNGWLRCSSILRSRIMFRTLSERTTGKPVSRCGPRVRTTTDPHLYGYTSARRSSPCPSAPQCAPFRMHLSLPRGGA